MIAIGGVIPEQDFEPLREAGVDAIFPPGTVVAEAAMRLLERLNQRLGYTSASLGLSRRNTPRSLLRRHLQKGYSLRRS